ncbi:hypothetical protein V8C86DRAFT_2939940 [Haematococcus lacustris]
MACRGSQLSSTSVLALASVSVVSGSLCMNGVAGRPIAWVSSHFTCFAIIVYPVSLSITLTWLSGTLACERSRVQFP